MTKHNGADFWFEKWMNDLQQARQIENIELREFVLRHAAICHMEYRCHVAQEWEGARK